MGDPKTMRVSAIVLALVLCLARANEYDFDNDVPEELLSRTEAVVPEEMLTQGLHSVRYKGAAPDVDLSEVVEWSMEKNASRRVAGNHVTSMGTAARDGSAKSTPASGSHVSLRRRSRRSFPKRWRTSAI